MAAQLKAVEPDDRADLRAAVARIATCQDAVARAEQARAHIHDRVLAAFRTRDDARARLRQAEADGQQHRVSYLLGEMPDGHPALSTLRETADDAESLLTAAQDDERLLDEEIRRRRTALSFAEDARTAAVAAVLRPHADILMAARHRYLAQAQAFEEAIRVLPIEAVPHDWDAQRDYPRDLSLAARWRDVALALETDADTEIPEET